MSSFDAAAAMRKLRWAGWLLVLLAALVAMVWLAVLATSGFMEGLVLRGIAEATLAIYFGWVASVALKELAPAMEWVLVCFGYARRTDRPDLL